MSAIIGKPWIHLSDATRSFYLAATLNSWRSGISFPHDKWQCQPFVRDHTCTLYQRKCRWHGETQKRKCVDQDDENGWVQPWYRRFHIRSMSFLDAQSNHFICNILHRRKYVLVLKVQNCSGLLKTDDIHPPKTGISVHFSCSLP